MINGTNIKENTMSTFALSKLLLPFAVSTLLIGKSDKSKCSYCLSIAFD